MRTRVKICGITRLEDALKAVELGADALGFVFHKPSPRYVDPGDAGAIIAKISRLVTTVGVFVDLPAGEVRRISEVAGLDRAQLSGAERPDYCRDLGMSYIKAFRLKSVDDIEQIREYDTSGDKLLDSYKKGVPGGTGETFNWEWASVARTHGRVVLAGGLRPENVAEAIRTAGPFAVDVSSGVESAPGIKDHAKLAAFFEAVREADNANTN